MDSYSRFSPSCVSLYPYRRLCSLPGYAVHHSLFRHALSLAIALAVGLGMGAPLHTIAQAQSIAKVAPPVPEKLVATATIQEVSGGMFKYVFLPVMIQGRAMTIILDLGAPTGLLLSSSAVASWGGAVPDVLDSLVIGTHVEHNVPVVEGGFTKEAPPDMPPLAGVLGTDILRHYDMLFDGPAHRVQLYLPVRRAAANSTAHRSTWLPSELTQNECTRMLPVGDPANRRVGFAIQANGKAVTGYFDSGAKRNNMNFMTAQVLGVDTASPNVRFLPNGFPGAFPLAGVSTPVWEVRGVTLAMGQYHLTDSPISLRTEYHNSDARLIGLGLDAISTRLLFVSYSTRQVCLSEPH